MISRRGKETARRRLGRGLPETDGDDGFKSYLVSGPSLEGVDLERARDLPRPVDLDD